MGGISSSQKMSMLPQSKVTILSGIVSSKYPGVALPLEMEKNSNLSAAAKRAHEDIILEEAKLIKVCQKILCVKIIWELIWVGYKGRTLIGMLQYIHNEGNHIGIKSDISSDNIQSHQHPKEVNVAQDLVPRNVAASMVVSEDTYQTSCQANDKVGTDKFVENVVVLEPSLNRRYVG